MDETYEMVGSGAIGDYQFEGNMVAYEVPTEIRDVSDSKLVVVVAD